MAIGANNHQSTNACNLFSAEASRNKKPSLLDEEGLRFKKGSSLLDDEGMRFKKGASLLNDEGMRFKKGASLLNDEGMRFKKESSLLNDEGMRFKKGSYLEDEGLRFKKMPRDLFEPNAKIRKSVLDGEGLRFKKESSLLDDEGMRFRRSKMTPLDRQNEGEMIKRYGFPGRLFSFYPFTMDLSNSYERRSDRSGNKDILEGEGMRF